MKFWRNYQRTITITFLFAATFFLAGYFERYHIPKIKRWILFEVEKQSQKRSPIRIWPKNVKLRLFPIGAVFYNVRLLPKPKLATQISSTLVKQIEVNFSLWALFKGEMRISNLIIEDGQLDINLGPSTVAKKNIYSLAEIDDLPIDSLVLRNINLHINNLPENISATLDGLNITIENQYQTLRVGLLINSVLLRANKKTELFSGRVSTQFLLDNEGLYISNVRIAQQQSQIQGTGAITGDILNLHFKEITAKIIGDISAANLMYFKKFFTYFEKIKSTSGSIKFETDLKYNFKDYYRSNFALKSENFKINQFDIGQLDLVGKILEKKLFMTKFSVQNDFGLITANDFIFQLNEAINFTGTISSKKLSLKKILSNLGLPNVPVYTDLDGQLPCEGTLRKKFLITCNGQINGKNFSVIRNEKNVKPIVSFENFSVSGSVTIDESEVQYKTSLQIGKSKGDSAGTINYQTGFNITYSSPLLNFSDIAELAQLKPEGQVEIKGVTVGNSRAATLALNASGENLWLKDFSLGKAHFSLEYAKGLIHVKKIEGQFNKTRYNGNLSIDLHSDKLQFIGASPFLDADDLINVFKRKVALPFAITGTGSATLNVFGPFQFNLLSYDLTSTLFRGTIADESFDQLNFNVISQNGYVKSKHIEIIRGSSRIRTSGNVNPDGQMNVDILGQNFQIEQFENLNRLKLNLTGNLGFEAKLSGHIFSPDLFFKGHIAKMTVDDRATKDSDLEFQITKNEISGKAQFMGPAVSIKFKRMRDLKGDTQLHVAVHQWDFAQIFSIFTDALRDGNYLTSVTGKLDLTFPNMNLSHYSGSLIVDAFKVKNGTEEMSASQPLSITAQDGILSTKNFEITGKNTYLRLKTKADPHQKLNLTIEGRINLSLAILFTPFMDDLRGLLSFSYGLNGTYENPQFNGSAFLEDGFFKIKGFSHSFEKVASDANFNNNRIIINNVTGKLADGHFSGRGKVDVLGASKIPIDIKGEFQDVKLNIPSGFFTKGYGDFYIGGQWFPYTVGVNYSVLSGSIERKTSEFSKSSSEIKPSAYLPKFLSAERFTPITLDLNVDIKKTIPVRMVINRIDIRTDVIGQMRVLGPPENALLKGKIGIIKGGKVTFRNNAFEIKNGYVEYNFSPPDNPTLNIQANSVVKAQLRDGRTRDYDVDLLVQGAAAKPKITMSSQPPLAENDLISLLTLGFINEETIEQGETPAGEKIANTSYQLTSAFLSDNLGINQVLEKQLGLHFDFSSSYDTSDKAEKHKFILSKQWSPKFGTTASREIGKTNSNNVKAEYKLDKNLSVIGQWEGKEVTGSDLQTTSDKDLNIFGLDMEYKVDFR